jgi:hypothetical protein
MYYLYSAFFTQKFFKCFLPFSEHTVIIYLKTISRAVFVTETYCVLSETGTDYSVYYLDEFC